MLCYTYIAYVVPFTIRLQFLISGSMVNTFVFLRYAPHIYETV